MDNKSTYTRLGLFLVSIIVILLGVSAAVVVLTTPVVGGAQGSAVGIRAPTIPPETACAEFFMVGTEIPLEKRMRQMPAYQSCVQARSSPPPPPEAASRFRRGTPEPTSFGDSPRRQAGAGTIVEEPGPRFGSTLWVDGMWYTEGGGKRITIYSVTRRGDGAMPLPPPWEAMLIIEVTSLDNATVYPNEQGLYPLPGRPGSVKIIDAIGQRLTLKEENGTIFHFDVPTRRLFSASGTPIPVQTPTRLPYP